MARIVIVTDAWYPQVNGVVRTVDMTVRKLREYGHEVLIIEPTGIPQVAVPFYPEIRICFPLPGRIYRRIRQFQPDYVHISTEGPLGMTVRQFCIHHGWNFSTSYHTKFPEYLKRLIRLPESITYWFLRRFHNRANPLMTATASLEAELKAHGFRSAIRRWSRGVDLAQFRPQSTTECPYPRPVLLYVGRVSAEKNIEAFLKLKSAGTKIVVGDGPQRIDLERRYPDARFLGYQKGEALAACYSMADLFVFPSQTDTFGLVVIEALACGVPVAAYDVTGPRDIITRPELGAVHPDLEEAVKRALQSGNRDACIAEAQNYTWDHCTRQFLEQLIRVKK